MTHERHTHELRDKQPQMQLLDYPLCVHSHGRQINVKKRRAFNCTLTLWNLKSANEVESIGQNK